MPRLRGMYEITSKKEPANRPSTLPLENNVFNLISGGHFRTHFAIRQFLSLIFVRRTFTQPTYDVIGIVFRHFNQLVDYF